MRDYRKHLTLLPHRWQAWALFAAGVLAVVYWVLFFFIRKTGMTVKDATIHLYLLGIEHVFVSVALMIACLSKEEFEDEYVTSVRYRALTISLFMLFIVRAIVEMIYGPIHNLVFSPTFNYQSTVLRSIIEAPILGKIYRALRYLCNSNIMMLCYLLLLKILKRTGGGNSYGSLLLPCTYKKGGWYILAVSMILIPALLVFVFVIWYKRGDAAFWNGGKSFWDVYEANTALFRLIILLPYIAIILICLSKEKQEDEFIRHIRVRTLICFVIIYLIIGYVHSLSENMYQVYLMRSMKTISYIGVIPLLILRLASWLPFAAVVYSLVLRKVLSNNLKESGNEE
ncbi:MAG: hypothetical protein J6T18_00535 [Bacteroidaceae bacterium]|nr:hypothetical protein [Bacteroidaceae bacterium]